MAITLTGPTGRIPQRRAGAPQAVPGPVASRFAGCSRRSTPVSLNR